MLTQLLQVHAKKQPVDDEEGERVTLECSIVGKILLQVPDTFTYCK